MTKSRKFHGGHCRLPKLQESLLFPTKRPSSTSEVDLVQADVGATKWVASPSKLAETETIAATTGIQKTRSAPAPRAGPGGFFSLAGSLSVWLSSLTDFRCRAFSSPERGASSWRVPCSREE